MTNSKIMILGVGNVLLTDEGAGIHILKELEKHELPEDTELLEGGTAGMELLSLIEEVDHLVIVDSVNAGVEPGAIFKFKPDDISVLPPEFNVSFHQVGLLEVLKMGQIFGKLPKTVTIFGIQPKTLQWGLELTPEVAIKIPKLTELVLQEVWDLAKN
jgi:hydrogenase maturation protease